MRCDNNNMKRYRSFAVVFCLQRILLSYIYYLKSNKYLCAYENETITQISDKFRALSLQVALTKAYREIVINPEQLC